MRKLWMCEGRGDVSFRRGGGSVAGGVDGSL